MLKKWVRFLRITAPTRKESRKHAQNVNKLLVGNILGPPNKNFNENLLNSIPPYMIKRTPPNSSILYKFIARQTINIKVWECSIFGEILNQFGLNSPSSITNSIFISRYSRFKNQFQGRFWALPALLNDITILIFWYARSF